MPRKDARLRGIDQAPAIRALASIQSNAVDDIAPPANPQISAPEGLALTTTIVFSTASPQAAIDATWDSVTDATASSYTIQVSTNTSFTASGTITATTTGPSAHVEGLLPGTLYYVRVRAVAGRLAGEWSSMSPLVTGENRITTATDTVPASAPGSPTLTWVGVGDARITWTDPTEANYKWTHIRIRASAGGTIYRELDRRGGVFLYTLSMNQADQVGAGDSSLYVELYSVTYSNVNSATVNTGLVTKAVPGAPAGVAQSWSGDTGTAGPDLTISWTAATDAAAYQLTLDGVARQVAGNRYTYTLDANRAEHSGTPDPAVAYSLVALDGFGQVSTAVAATATNAAPATPTATLEQGAVGGLHATVTSTPPADFLTYEYVFKRESTTVITILSRAATAEYPMQLAADQGYHSWTVVVRQQDVYGQFSSAVTPAAVAFEALTLTGLRAQAAYTDSVGNSASTLAVLKDGITTSGGVSYAA